MDTTTKHLSAVVASFFLAGLFSASLLSSPTATAATTSAVDSTDPTIPEVHIGSDGTATVKGMKVWQTAGRSLFTRTTWDQSFIRWTVKTTAETVISKRYGDKMTVYDIAVGDYLSAEGYIEGGNSLAMVATKITDWSNYQAKTSFPGKITSLGPDNLSFTLSNNQYGDIVVNLSSTTAIIRNRREITPQYLKVGDRILSISGVYDHQAKTLAADKINVYINLSIFEPKNYQGSLVSLADHTLPTMMSANVNGKIYKVELGTNTVIFNSQRRPATLDRFLPGDTVRFYGFIRQDNDELDTINASILRNTSF